MMSDMPPFTDADVARHRLVIAKREAVERTAREANHRAEHPRDLAEYVGEGDVFDGPPIVERPAKGSTPFKVNRGLGIPTEDE
jgi:hypothetical protein